MGILLIFGWLIFGRLVKCMCNLSRLLLLVKFFKKHYLIFWNATVSQCLINIDTDITLLKTGLYGKS